jgi:hypothetical protein
MVTSTRADAIETSQLAGDTPMEATKRDHSMAPKVAQTAKRDHSMAMRYGHPGGAALKDKN